MAEIVLGPRQYYFLFFIKRFNYPISARDAGNDLVRQRANRIAQSLDNFFQRSKYFVMESTLSNLFPNLSNRVHFRRIWWDIESESIPRQSAALPSIGIAILPDMVARHTETNPFFTPAVFWLVDPPKSSLILKH